MKDAPYERISGTRRDLLFLCDHASNAVPPDLGDLGLPDGERARHIAYDIGARPLTLALAARFDAPAILGRWSRLVIDLNRGTDDPTLVMKLSDGAIVPGNRALSSAGVAARIAAYHAPYHGAISATIDAALAAGTVTALISIHSFTPAWKGGARPWHVGVLHDRDVRIARPLMALLGARGDLVIGDNAPYSGELENDCLNVHGTRRGLPHVLIEVRQDLVGDDAGVARMAGIIGDALAEVLFDRTIHSIAPVAGRQAVAGPKGRG